MRSHTYKEDSIRIIKTIDRTFFFFFFLHASTLIYCSGYAHNHLRQTPLHHLPNCDNSTINEKLWLVHPHQFINL